MVPPNTKTCLSAKSIESAISSLLMLRVFTEAFAASGLRLVGPSGVTADAAAEFLQARLHSLLDDFRRLGGGLQRGFGRLTSAVDSGVKDFLCELSLLGEDFLRIAERLIAAGQGRGFAQTRFEHLALLLRHGPRAARGGFRRFSERFDVLAIGLDQFLDIDLWKPEVGSEVTIGSLCSLFPPFVNSTPLRSSPIPGGSF